MSRVQLALNVEDLDRSVEFYSKLLGTEPSKLRPGYANFASDDPPLKLVLIENAEAAGTLNHLGIEVATAADVVGAGERLASEGLGTEAEESVACCYALQDKVWVESPDHNPWEFYTVLEDLDAASEPEGLGAEPAAICCQGACG